MSMKKIKWLAIVLLFNMPLFSMIEDHESDSGDVMHVDGNSCTTTEEYSDDEDSNDENSPLYLIGNEKLAKATKIIHAKLSNLRIAATLVTHLNTFAGQKVSKERWGNIIKFTCIHLPAPHYTEQEKEELSKLQPLLDGIIDGQ
jgi:hypothetical protein